MLKILVRNGQGSNLFVTCKVIQRLVESKNARTKQQDVNNCTD